MLFGKYLIDYELCTLEKLGYHIVLVLKPLIKKMLFLCACAHDVGSVRSAGPQEMAHNKLLHTGVMI